MKTKTLIANLVAGENSQFNTKGSATAVRVEPSLSDDGVRVYIGDGDGRADYQFAGPADLREIAKKFKALADHLDTQATAA